MHVSTVMKYLSQHLLPILSAIYAQPHFSAMLPSLGATTYYLLCCRGMFATHYHKLADAHMDSPHVALKHMACQVEEGPDGTQQVCLMFSGYRHKT